MLVWERRGGNGELENSTIGLRVEPPQDGRSLVQIQVAARYHQLDHVGDRRRCSGARCLSLVDNPVQKSGEGDGLAIVGFRFFQADSRKLRHAKK